MRMDRELALLLYLDCIWRLLSNMWLAVRNAAQLQQIGCESATLEQLSSTIRIVACVEGFAIHRC